MLGMGYIITICCQLIDVDYVMIVLPFDSTACGLPRRLRLDCVIILLTYPLSVCRPAFRTDAESTARRRQLACIWAVLQIEATYMGYVIVFLTYTDSLPSFSRHVFIDTAALVTIMRHRYTLCSCLE